MSSKVRENPFTGEVNKGLSSFDTAPDLPGDAGNGDARELPDHTK
jgi:hypothetical protein